MPRSVFMGTSPSVNWAVAVVAPATEIDEVIHTALSLAIYYAGVHHLRHHPGKSDDHRL